MQRRQLLTMATSLALPLLARAQAATLRVILPVPPGGPSDGAARALLQAMGKASGRSLVFDNKPGAGGALAARALMDARPDGQTVMWTLASMTGIPLLQKTPPFQSLAEFTPVGVVGRFTFAMFVPADAPARSVAEFIALARERGARAARENRNALPAEVAHGARAIGHRVRHDHADRLDLVDARIGRVEHAVVATEADVRVRHPAQHARESKTHRVELVAALEQRKGRGLG